MCITRFPALMFYEFQIKILKETEEKLISRRTFNQ